MRRKQKESKGFWWGLGMVLALAGTVLLVTEGVAVQEPSPTSIRLNSREVSLGRILPGIVVESLRASPDSRRVAYAARKGGKWVVVADGKAGPEFDGIGEGTLLFSPDSRRVAYAAQRGEKVVVVVDGKEGPEHDGFLRGSRLVFDDARHLHGLVLRGDEILRVEVEITPAPGEP